MADLILHSTENIDAAALIRQWIQEEKSGNKHPVPFDLAWTIAGHSTKGNAKRVLCNYLIQGEDYLFINLRKSTGGRASEDFRLTCDAFKELCMLSRSEQGKTTRRYFIAAEKELMALREGRVIPQQPSPALIKEAVHAILDGIVDDHLIKGCIAESTRKHYPELAESIDEAKKLLPKPTETAHSITVTELAALYGDRTGIKLTAIAMNQLLKAKGFQRETGKKEPRWEPIGQGNEFAEMVLQTAKGRDRTCYLVEVESLRALAGG